MPNRRLSGILLHPTSLPSRFGIGDLGSGAFRFADWLQAAGQRLWQVLPLGPTGYGDSPYQLFSAFAGNPLLISPERLVEEGYLTGADLPAKQLGSAEAVAFEQVIPVKRAMLAKAYVRFAMAGEGRSEFDQFCAEQREWLDDFALFAALKQNYGVQHVWTAWPAALVRREAKAIENCLATLSHEIAAEKFYQWQFAKQWQALRAYCHERGIQFMGDLPIYVAHDSADVWSHPDLFKLDAQGCPTVIAGVPPDYFSATGQRWGNPIYNWDRARETGFAWWIERFRATLAQFDLCRLDHFRGFEAFWEIPANEPTAVNGRWLKAPGAELFRAVTKALGPLPIVAENLGVITPEVEAIRQEFGFPGMSILQFAFGTDPQSPDFKPHNFPTNRFAYTGTHDNDTAMGWWNSTGGDSTRTPAEIEAEKNHALDYLGLTGIAPQPPMNWSLIRSLLASVAHGAVMPLQDVLGLGSEARFNTPGVPGGNWRWRFREGDLTPALAAQLQHLVHLYDRGA